MSDKKEESWYWNPNLNKFQNQPPGTERRIMVRRTRKSPIRAAVERSWAFFGRHRTAGTATLVTIGILLALFAGRLAFTSSPSVTIGIPETVAPSKAASDPSSALDTLKQVAPAPIPVPPPTLVTTAVTTLVPIPGPPPASVEAPTTTAEYYAEGVCLSGTIPDTGGVAVPANDIAEVPCSSPTAHYKVIHALPGTTDLGLCDQSRNPRTPYAFSEEVTENGVPTRQYVYCMIAIR